MFWYRLRVSCGILGTSISSEKTINMVIITWIIVLPCSRILAPGHVGEFLELQKWDRFAVDNPVFLLKPWSWVVERLQTWSNNNQSRLCAEILEWFGTYCIQDQFRNDTMVLREVESAEVPFVAEVVEQLKFDTHDTSLITRFHSSHICFGFRQW